MSAFEDRNLASLCNHRSRDVYRVKAIAGTSITANNLSAGHGDRAVALYPVSNKPWCWMRRV